MLKPVEEKDHAVIGKDNFPITAWLFRQNYDSNKKYGFSVVSGIYVPRLIIAHPCVRLSYIVAVRSSRTAILFAAAYPVPIVIYSSDAVEHPTRAAAGAALRRTHAP